MMYSVEAEQSVLGAIMLDGSVLHDVMEVLSGDDFYRNDHQAIFRAMVELHPGDVDPVTIYQHMVEQGGDIQISYIVEIAANTPSAANVKSYAQIVKDKSKKRTLMATVNVIAESVERDQASSPDDLISNAASLIGALQVADGEGLRNTKQVLKSLSHQWDKRAQSGGGIDGFETGLADIDKRHLGWKPGDLIVIAGRPSMGKSLLAFQIGIRASVERMKRVLGFSLEMTAERLLERATANIGSVPLDVLRKCKTDDFATYQHEILLAAQRIANADFLIDETPGLHINQICARARNAHRRSPLDLVIVDHINIATGGGKGAKEYEQVSAVSGGLKKLAKELGCPVVAVTQLNRDVEASKDKRPGMNHLRGSGSIEQDADIIMLMYRDDYYNENSDQKGVVEVNTAKFREGEVGVDRLANQFNFARVGDLDYRNYTPPAEHKKESQRGFR